MKIFRRLRRDERGISILYVTTGFMAFFAATILAVDVGMLTTARSQAQNAADAGALAGAIALAMDDFEDRTASSPAVQGAVNAALANTVIGENVAVEPADVTFPAAPEGEAHVKVAVFRTDGRDNPLSTFIAAVFGMGSADVQADATARTARANAMTCVRPFTIPDKWDENQDPDWTPESEFRRYDNAGDLIEDADEYFPPGHPDYRGYVPAEDKGTVLTLRAGTGNNIEPTFYYSWKMPGAIGADYYEENIFQCNQAVFTPGAEMIQEPGNMVGPTVHGVELLVEQDPTAYWDDVHERVVSPLGRSPRIFPIPLYDPDLYDQGKVNGRNATLIMRNWIGFFVEEIVGNEVIGRIVPILGTIDEDAGPAPEGIFPMAVQLIE